MSPITNFITICIWGLLLIRNKFNQHCQKILNPWAYLFRHQIRGSVASVYAACKWWVSWKEFSLSKNLIGTLLSGYPPSLELIHKKLWCRRRIDLMKYPMLCSHSLYSKTKQQCPPSQCCILLLLADYYHSNMPLPLAWLHLMVSGIAITLSLCCTTDPTWIVVS